MLSHSHNFLITVYPDFSPTIKVIKPTCEAAAFHEWNPAPLTYHNPHHFQLFFPPQVLYPEVISLVWLTFPWSCLQPTAPVPVPSPADWSNPYLQHQLQQHALIQQSHQQQQHDSHDMKVGEVEESKSKSLKVSVPTGFGESTRCDPASFARLSSVVHRVRKERGREKVGFQTVFLQWDFLAFH